MPTGSCLCAAVTFEVTGDLRQVVYCHCKQCRKQTGHFVAATRADDKDLTIEGAENLTWYAASNDATRGFCKSCGSLMFWRSNGATRTSIMAGTFDAPSGLRQGFHIYAADKGEYYEICDGLPVFEHAD